MLQDGKPGRRRIRKCLPADQRRRAVFEIREVAHGVGRFFVIPPLGIGGIQNRDHAQMIIDLPALLNQRRHLVERPYVETPRLHRHEQQICHGQRRAQAPGIPAPRRPQ